MEKKVARPALDAVVCHIPAGQYSCGRDVGRTHGIICHYNAGRLVATECWVLDYQTKDRVWTYTIEAPDEPQPSWSILELSQHSAMWLRMDCHLDGKLVHSAMAYVTSHTELPLLSKPHLYELLERAAKILARDGNISVDSLPVTNGIIQIGEVVRV